MRINLSSVTVAATLFLGGLPQVMARSHAIEAITRPSGDVTLSFTQPGRLASVLVHAGDAVHSGQVLARQDDSVEKAKFAVDQARANSVIKISAAKDELAQKQTDLAKLKTAARDNAVTVYEVQHARLAVAIARLAVSLAVFNHEQRQMGLVAEKLQLRHMRLATPISGVVEKVYVHPGETVNAQDKVVRVVQINPLWVRVPVPLDRAAGLRLDQTVPVKFPGGKVTQGKIIRIAQVADAASDTLAVRVRVANPAQRPAGEHVRIILPAAHRVASGSAPH